MEQQFITPISTNLNPIDDLVHEVLEKHKN